MTRGKLIKSLSCPLEWGEVCAEAELVVWLKVAWYAVAREHEVDREVRGLISYDDFAPSSFELETFDADEVKAALTNVCSWHKTATKAYKMAYGGLYRQRALRRDEMGKHYAQRALTADEVMAESKERGDSVLRPAIAEKVQTRLFWAALNDVVCKRIGCNFLEAHEDPVAPSVALTQVFGRNVLLVAANCNRPVGASDGNETPYLLFNADLANGHFHCYPILEREYDQEPFKAYVHGWNYGLAI